MTASQEKRAGASADVHRANTSVFDAAALSACISCGFCLPACPTYATTRDERSSPRGRINLMRALHEGRLEPDDASLREQSSFCLGCRACEPACPAGVPYGQLLEQWRDHQWRGRRTPLKVAALRVALRMRMILAIGGRLRRAAATSGPASGEGPQLMLGCAERVLFPRVSRAVRRLIPGVQVPSGQGCCGALHAHNGASRMGVRLAEDLGRRMPGTILTTSGGCAAHLAHVLGRDRVRELSELLHAGDLPDLGPVTVGGRRARVALQDSCHLRNGLGTHRQPRELIARVADLVELPSAATCCGAAGTYSLLRPRDAAAVLAPKLDEIDAAGVDYVVVVNPGCQRQLVAGLRRRRSPTQVLHLAELLALAAVAAPPNGATAP
ncbi:(Fe-S)-binding protein [Dactylosporangium sp. NPDC050688]|uniref:(Fe-S)-binding protein n=1 Tax=Dactylosporangium sp. NPDC050688 TaxID=3157217 RepID=UPI0033F1890C